MKQTKQYLRLNSSTGTDLKTELLEGVEHLVVPCVFMVEGVHKGAGQDSTLEHGVYYPSDILEMYAFTFDGVPFVLNHPEDEGSFVSANQVDVLNEYAFGRVFNARVEEGKLKGDIYLNTAKAESLGEDAMLVVERVQAGERVEVSLGAIGTLIFKDGSFEGQLYNAIAESLIGDHVAALPFDEGACSVEKGCGLMANKKGDEDESFKLSRFLNRLKTPNAQLANGLNSELRKALNDALEAKYGYYDYYLSDYDSENSFVIYELWDESSSSWGKLQKASFTYDEANVTAELGEAEQVVQKKIFAPVTNTKDCGCDEEGTMNKELVNKIIANKGNPYTEKNRAVLETMDENQLELINLADAPKEAVEEEAAPAVAAPVINKAAIAEAFGTDVSTLETVIANAGSEKTRLVNKLKGQFPEADLMNMSTDFLKSLDDKLNTDDDFSLNGGLINLGDDDQEEPQERNRFKLSN